MKIRTLLQYAALSCVLTACGGESIDVNEVIEGGIQCTEEYMPVCALDEIKEACLSMPCPRSKYKTYSNQCMAEASGALYSVEGACGDKEGLSPSSLSANLSCTMQFDPVCAKDDVNIQCVTEPCPSHSYSTLGNACVSAVALAETVFKGECGNLEGVLSFAQAPVKLVSNTALPVSEATLLAASIDADILKLKLEYSSCEGHHYDVLVNTSAQESYPPQYQAVFVSRQETSCDTLIQVDHEYDLLPLKILYQEQYPNTEGRLNIAGALYEF